MGACYTVNIHVKLTDEEGAIRALQEYIKTDTHTDYALEKNAKLGITPDTFDGLMRIFLADWGKGIQIEKDPSGWMGYSNDFDASYGWEGVLHGMFNSIKPFLEKGSVMIGDVDADQFQYIVGNRVNTGFCDCHGKPIYVGDTVYEGCNGLVSTVEWNPGRGSFWLNGLGEGYGIENAHIEWEVLYSNS